MTVETTLLLMDTYYGFQVLEANTKQTLFSKNTIGSRLESELKRAIAQEDDATLGMIIAALFQSAMDGGWGNAPGAYLLKHNGYMFGNGLYTRNGIKSDLTFTVRTDGPIV